VGVDGGQDDIVEKLIDREAELMKRERSLHVLEAKLKKLEQEQLLSTEALKDKEARLVKIEESLCNREKELEVRELIKVSSLPEGIQNSQSLL
jgi:hypothetical protein